MTDAAEIVVVIPTLNEADSIEGVLQALKRQAVVNRVIVADGGSTDRTGEIAVAHGATFLSSGSGYGRACLTAAQSAPAGAILVFMDGDGADDPGSIDALVAPVRNGTHDLVLGSRVLGRREPGSMAWHQVLAGRAAGVLVGCLYGVRYTDMCAFRAIRRETVLALDMRELTYGWNLEMQMRAARTGLHILELAVPYRCRSGGESKVAGSLRGTLRAGTRIVATFLRIAAEPRRRLDAAE